MTIKASDAISARLQPEQRLARQQWHPSMHQYYVNQEFRERVRQLFTARSSGDSDALNVLPNELMFELVAMLALMALNSRSLNSSSSPTWSAGASASPTSTASSSPSNTWSSSASTSTKR